MPVFSLLIVYYSKIISPTFQVFCLHSLHITLDINNDFLQDVWDRTYKAVLEVRKTQYYHCIGDESRSEENILEMQTEHKQGKSGLHPTKIVTHQYQTHQALSHPNP